MPRFVSVATCDAVPNGSGHRVNFEDKEIAIFRVGEQYYAIDNECPHYGAQLCHGTVHNDSVACPWHWWQFKLTDGKSLTVPGMDVRAYAVRVEGNDIQVDFEDPAPTPAPAAESPAVLEAQAIAEKAQAPLGEPPDM